MPHTLTSESAKWILPLLLTGAVGTSTALFTWAKDWNSSARRLRSLDEATKRLQFWDAWLKSRDLHKLTASDAEVQAARLELDRAAKTVRRSLERWPEPDEWTRAEYRGYLRRVGIFRRLFLFYKQPTSVTRALRIAVYVTLLLLVYAIYSHLNTRDTRPDSTTMYMHLPSGTLSHGATYYDSDPEAGFPIPLGEVRSETRLDLISFCYYWVLLRLISEIYIWSWVLEAEEKDRLRARLKSFAVRHSLIRVNIIEHEPPESKN